MKNLFAIYLILQGLCYAQQTTNQNIYDARLTYNASPNGYVTTTGTIAASSHTLTVASATGWGLNMGVLVTGGCASGCTTQASGTFLWTYITAISGTTLTLNDAAGASVSGGRVAHDETRAINAALAGAYNHGGGTALLSIDPLTNNCAYKVSGPFNGSTNSVLTLPQNLNVDDPIRLNLVGQIFGYSVDNLTLTGGCGIDFTDAPAASGTKPALIAGAPYVVITSGNFTTSFEAVEYGIDGLYILGPNQSALNGVLLNNVASARIGMNAPVGIATKADSANTWSQPTGGTTALWMPGWLNDVKNSVGEVTISGWNVCHTPGEHEIMSGPYLINCNSAMTFFKAHDLISGTVRIEQVPLMWSVDASVSDEIPINIIADNETSVSVGPVWSRRGANDLVDTGNHLFGQLNYKIKDETEAYKSINLNGGANLVYCNDGVAPVGGSCGTVITGATTGAIVTAASATTLQTASPLNAATGVVVVSSGVPAVASGTSSNCVLVNGTSAPCDAPGQGAAGNATPVTANANSTSAQALMEVSVPTGLLNVATGSSGGTTLIHGSGIFTIQTLQVPTISVITKLCTVSGCGSGTVVILATNTTTATVAATANTWNLNLKVATVATGTSGTLLTHGSLAIDIGATSAVADSVFNDSNTAASSAINLTGALYVDFFVTFSAQPTTPFNSFTQQVGSVEPASAIGPLNPTTSGVTATFTYVSGTTWTCTTTGGTGTNSCSVTSSGTFTGAAAGPYVLLTITDNLGTGSKGIYCYGQQSPIGLGCGGASQQGYVDFAASTNASYIGFALGTTPSGVLTVATANNAGPVGATGATGPAGTVASQYKVWRCTVITGDPGSASAILVNDNDSPVACQNNTGVDITLTGVSAWADAGSPTVTPILTGGSGTSILTGALTAGTAAWAAGTLNGTVTIHSFSANDATCSVTPCTIDSNITTAGGTAKYLVVQISGIY